MATENKAGCNAGGCLGFFVLSLFLLFLGLKLGEVGVVASWSWWWVAAPLWIYGCTIAAVVIFVVAAFLTVAALKD